MNKDFWGFKNEEELKRKIVDVHETVLKEQMENLGEKTGYVIYGTSSLIRIKNTAVKYEIATIFELVVPALDNYRKTLLIMYSKTEVSYPVAITVGKSYEEDMEAFNPDYECTNKSEFEDALKEILQSQEIMNLIALLYSKAKSAQEMNN